MRLIRNLKFFISINYFRDQVNLDNIGTALEVAELDRLRTEKVVFNRKTLL
jgi:hypothetical protein